MSDTANFTAPPWHPILRPMRATVERMHGRNEARAWALHAALATLNGRASFQRSPRDGERGGAR